MKFRNVAVVSAVLLLLADNSDALAQGRGNAYGGQQRGTVVRRSSKPPAENFDAVRRIGYEAGYAGRPENWQAHTKSNEGVYHYQQGYYQGRIRGEEVAREARHKELLGLYGSEANVKAFEMGFDAGTNNRKYNLESKPPDKQDPSAYIAYVEGYHNGKRGTEELPGESAHPDEALPLTQLYVEQLNAMQYESERYYVLLEKVNKNFELGGKTPTVAESLARSAFALEVAKELFETHHRLHQHAWSATQLNPRLVAALNASATRLLRDKEANEFPTLQRDLHANADQMATQARKVAAEPVSVPEDFDKLGRFHRASIDVISRTLEVDRIRLTLASGRTDPEAMLVGIREYTRFCKSWQVGHLREWKESRLPRMYGAVGAKPPVDTMKLAEEDVDRFLQKVSTSGR